MSDEEEAIERAKSLFAAGAEVIYLAVEDQDHILVRTEPPNRPGVVVAARSISEIRRFLRDLKPNRRP
jgi:2-methylisocitrate lyase-like PEP mutase family enzyme